MFELPLFPLNVVLFPGMPLALHIFEDRYKLMIGKCLQERRPFGVVLIRQGAEAHGPLPEPDTIGCTAFVTQVERLQQGRMNIGAIGQRRFRIVSLDTDLPYLRGQVEYYPLLEDDPSGQEALANRLRPWIVRYLDNLSRLGDDALPAENLPAEPVPLAYVAAALLQISTRQKQELLSIKKATTLLAELRKLYRSEIAILKVIGQLPGPEMDEDPGREQNPFSLN
jgi:Lon protease-like protein